MRVKRMPDVYSYTDYRELLKDLLKFNKGNNNKFTYRYFSQKAGYSSSGILKDVIEGRRKLPIKSLHKFIGPFKLSPKQEDYFELLVHFNTANNSEDRRKYFRELIRYQRTKFSKTITKKEYKIYQKWYYSVVRCLVGLKQFKDDPQWIARQVTPPITPNQAKEAIKVLLDIGFIKRDKNGKLVQDTPKLKINPEESIIAVRELTRQLIEFEWESITKFDQNKREHLGIIMDMSEACYKEVMKMMRRFQEEVQDYININSGESEMVCFLGLSLFPFMKNMEIPYKGDNKNV